MLTSPAPFNAMPAGGKVDAPRWYDLTGDLPVLRTFDRGGASVREESTWSHVSALKTYNDEDLHVILDFLNEAIGK